MATRRLGFQCLASPPSLEYYRQLENESSYFVSLAQPLPLSDV